MEPNRDSEETYLRRVLGDQTAESSAAAPLRFSVFSTSSQQAKTGIEDIDVDMVVAQRALNRLMKSHPEDAALRLECQVVTNALVRIAKNVRQANGTSEPTAAPSLQKGPTNKVDSRGLEAFQRLQAQLPQKEADSIEDEVTPGMWTTLLEIARQGEGLYVFQYKDDSGVDRKAETLAESIELGLGLLGSRFCALSDPRITLFSISPPDEQPRLIRNSSLPKSCPSGLVDYLEGKNLPVVPSSSSLWGTCDIRNILTKSLNPFQTQNLVDSFITIDFGNCVVAPNAYGFSSIRHIIPGCFPVDWSLQGSVNGKDWVLIRRHEQDKSFSANQQSCVWPIEPLPSRQRRTSEEVHAGHMGLFRFLRVMMEGPNSFGSNELQLCGFEVYGNVMMVEPGVAPPLKQVTVSRRVAPPPAPPMLDVFGTAGKKKNDKKK